MRRHRPRRGAAESAEPVILIGPPADVPDYAAGAWASALSAAIGEPAIIAAFRADTGNRWTPGKTPLDRLIDEATGIERRTIEQFVAWFNENVWGPWE